MNSRQYHHGDLRAALVSAGLELLRERSADDLSLREVARRVGVSATAVYRHFPDKAALLTALAQEGLRALAAAQHAAFDATGGGVPGFSATGAAYVRFALANPALYRLIFSTPALSHDEADDEAMRFLKQNAAALAPARLDPQVFALQSWAIVHGLSLLLLDGQITLSDAQIERVIDVPGLIGQ